MKLIDIIPALLEASNQTSYTDKITTTDNKKTMSAWAASISKFYRPRNLCMYVVGNREGLERHIAEKRAMGFNDLGAHIVVEWNRRTYLDLEREKLVLMQKDPEIAKIRIRHGDIIKEAKNHPPGSISHLDFDTASVLDPALFARVVNELCKMDIDNIHMVFAQRLDNEIKATMWPKEKDPVTRLGGKWGDRMIQGKMRYDIPPEYHTILTQLLKNDIVGDYEVSETKSYKGKGQQMMMVVLNRWG